MDESSQEDYINFLNSQWCNTLFVEFSIENKLAAVAIVDLLDNALSAVYTFLTLIFTLQFGHLCSFMATKPRKIPGPRIHLSRILDKRLSKMSYKTQYQPLQGFINNAWEIIT